MRLRAAIGALIGAGGFAAAVPAEGATFTVSNTNDSGSGSLRQAVLNANGSSDESNTIRFSLPANSTIALATPLAALDNGSLVFDASASPGLTINGGGNTFLTNGSDSTDATLRNVSYTNGSIDLSDYEITFDEPDTGTIDGDLSASTITLVKTGVGKTTLNAGHSITLNPDPTSPADVRIDAGTLAVNGDLSSENLSVAASGTLDVGGDVTVTDQLTDDGTVLVRTGGQLTVFSLLVAPAGTLDVEGSADVTGELTNQGTVVASGNLTANSLTVASGATLDIDTTGTVDVAGELTNEGAVVADGTLTADSLSIAPSGTMDFGGTVNVAGAFANQGILSANGRLTAGSLLIDTQGILAGNSGSVAETIVAPVTVRGRVAPSTTTGLLRVTGPVSFESTSVLDLDLEPNDGDQVAVTGGLVTVAPGARIEFTTDPGAYNVPSTVDVLTSGSGITGSFVLGTDYAFLTESLVTTANAIRLTLTPRSFSDFAFTPNQQAVAQLLEAAEPGASGDLADALDAIQQSTASELPELLDAIGGESLTAFATARQILGERTARAIHRRARDPAWGDGRAFYLSEDPDVAAQGDERPLIDRVRPGAWFDALGTFGQLEGDRGEADVDTVLYGGTLGADAWIADHVVLGLAAGYARSDVDLDDRDADVFGDTAQGALYGGFIDPRGYLSAYGRYAYTFESSTRRIESSTLSRKAEADWDAQDYGAGAEAGVTLVSFRGFALQPIAGVDWLRLSEESYTESGAGSLGLIVDPETLETTTTRFGGRVFGRLDMGDPGVLVPELRAFYQHLSGDRERVLEARLSGAPGLTSIGVRGPEFPRDSFLLGVGWSVNAGERLTVSLDYDAVLGSDRVEHQGTVAARVAF